MIKCGKGEIGKPRFDVGDKIGFYLKPHRMDKEIFFVGSVYIVDAYGTFEQDDEPSYDIMVEDWMGTGKRMLVKHERESLCFILDEV